MSETPSEPKRLVVPRPLVAFVDDDAGYLGWIAANKDGYVLNAHRRPTLGRLTLHRATCRWVSSGERPWTADHAKICAPATAVIEDWVATLVLGDLDHCHFCEP